MHTIIYTEEDIAAMEENLKEQEEKKIKDIFDDVLKGDDIVKVGLKYRIPPSRIKRMFLSKAKKEVKYLESKLNKLDKYKNQLSCKIINIKQHRRK